MNLKLLNLVIVVGYCILYSVEGGHGSHSSDGAGPHSGTGNPFNTLIELLHQLENNITQYVDARISDVESALSSQHTDILSIIDTLSTISAEHVGLFEHINGIAAAHEELMTAMLADIFNMQIALESLVNTRIDALLSETNSGHQELLDTCSDCCSSDPPSDPTCPVEGVFSDCTEARDNGCSASGVYTIFPTGFESNGVEVLCDMNTSDAGWTVIQRRESDTDFYKSWSEYEAGFGSVGPDGNFWLGNSIIHAITSQGTYELRIDLTGDVTSGLEQRAAIYQNFNVGDAASKYTLTIGTFSYDQDYASPGDSLTWHNGRQFSTHDNDNDLYSGNCASLYKGAWWYNACHYSNLNGDWGNTNYAEGPVWFHFLGYFRPLSFTQMMIRRTA